MNQQNNEDNSPLVDLDELRRRHYLERKNQELSDIVPSATRAYLEKCLENQLPESIALMLTGQYHEFLLQNTSNLLDAAYVRGLSDEDFTDEE